MATRWGNKAAAKLLLLSWVDVDVNAKGKDGATSFSLATEGGHKQVVKLLLACDNIDVNLKNTDRHHSVSQPGTGTRQW